MNNSENDFDLIVIGAGAGGLVSSSFAAGLGLRVALISDGHPGGECLWSGCVPSKALIHNASIANILRKYAGDSVARNSLSFEQAMANMKDARERISHHDSVETVEKSGVTVIPGRARFLNSHSVEVAGRNLLSKKFIIATGGYQDIPPIDGLKEAGCLTHESVLELKESPRHLLIIGGGPVGVEYAQTMARLSVQVTVVEKNDRLLTKEEPETSEFVRQVLEKEGVSVHLQSKLARVAKADGRLEASIQTAESMLTVECDSILVASGKTPNTSSLALDKAGVATSDRGYINVDRHQRTSAKNIWACGDVCGSFQFTHYADHAARIAVLNACLGLPVKSEQHIVPWCTFLDPEIASVGMRKAAAESSFGKDAIVTLEYGLDDYDRAILDDAAVGFIKAVLTKQGKILGVTVAGQRAGELIHEFALAMKAGLKVTDLSSLIHVYPTMSGSIQNLCNGYYRAIAKDSWQSKLVKVWAGLLR